MWGWNPPHRSMSHKALQALQQASALGWWLPLAVLSFRNVPRTAHYEELWKWSFTFYTKDISKLAPQKAKTVLVLLCSTIQNHHFPAVLQPAPLLASKPAPRPKLWAEGTSHLHSLPKPHAVISFSSVWGRNTLSKEQHKCTSLVLPPSSASSGCVHSSTSSEHRHARKLQKPPHPAWTSLEVDGFQ